MPPRLPERVTGPFEKIAGTEVEIAAPPPRGKLRHAVFDFDGTIVWNGTPISDVAVLEKYFRVESQKDPQPELHMRPDKRAKYDTVARVLASAQRNRMKKIGFVNVSEFQD